MLFAIGLAGIASKHRFPLSHAVNLGCNPLTTDPIGGLLVPGRKASTMLANLGLESTDAPGHWIFGAMSRFDPKGRHGIVFKTRRWPGANNCLTSSRVTAVVMVGICQIICGTADGQSSVGNGPTPFAVKPPELYSAPLARQAKDRPRSAPATRTFLQAQRLLLNGARTELGRAVDLYRSAAEQHNPLAEYNLGYCYEYGIGVPPDLIAAVTFYRRAASHATDPELRSLAQASIKTFEGIDGQQQLRLAATPLGIAASAPGRPAVELSQPGTTDRSPAAEPGLDPSTVLPHRGPPVARDNLGTETETAVMSSATMPNPDPVRRTMTEPSSLEGVTGNDLLPAAVMASLLERGDAMLRSGNISAARLLYDRAATAGSTRAMILVGMTYDPRFFAQIGARGIEPAPATAAVWYRRAAGLGEDDAVKLLAGLAPVIVKAPKP